MSVTVETADVEPPALRSRGLHVAGRAALVAAVAWLTEPVSFVASLLNPANMDPEQTLADFWSAGLPFTYLLGVGEIVFGVALGLIVFAAETARPLPTTRRYSVTTAKGLGILAAAAMIVAGAIQLTGGGLAGTSLTTIPVDDEGARWLAYQSFVVVHEALRLAACLGFAAWLVVLARTGRRDGIIGRAAAITIVVAAVLISLPAAATGLLTGMNFVLLALLPLAVSFLRRAKAEEGSLR